MTMNRNVNGLVAGITLACLASAGTATAEQLRFATGSPQNTLGSKGMDAFIEAVEDRSGGDLTVKGYAQSLLSFMETPAGLRDGMADLGHVLTPYFPADFPNTIMLTEMTMAPELSSVEAKTAMFAYTGAVTEYIVNECPDCIQEHLDRNQVYLNLVSTSPYGLFCNGAVTASEDINGSRIRVGGPVWSRWVETMEGSPVSIPVNETYEGLSQGVVDCTAHNLSDLLNFKFIEVVTDVTMGVPGGTFGGVGTNINADTWRSLSTDDRTAILYGAARSAAEVVILYYEDHMEALRQIEESSDITLHEPDPELVEATRAFIEEDLETVAAHYQERYGIEDAEERMAAFRETLAEWVKKVEGVDTREELTDLYWTEVFSNIDVSTYSL